MSAKIPGLEMSQDEVSQTINLKELLGEDLTSRPDLKAKIAQEIVDLIVDRTESGKSVHNRSLRSYDEDYAESDEFAAFGKSESEVNMTLTGNMLNDIIDTSKDPNEIKISFRKDINHKKAFNHNTGDTVKKREFFGVNKSDLKEIVSKYKKELKKSEEKVPSRTALDILAAAEVFREDRSTVGGVPLSLISRFMESD